MLDLELQGCCIHCLGRHPLRRSTPERAGVGPSVHQCAFGMCAFNRATLDCDARRRIHSRCVPSTLQVAVALRFSDDASQGTVITFQIGGSRCSSSKCATSAHSAISSSVSAVSRVALRVWATAFAVLPGLPPEVSCAARGSSWTLQSGARRFCAWRLSNIPTFRSCASGLRDTNCRVVVSSQIATTLRCVAESSVSRSTCELPRNAL